MSEKKIFTAKEVARMILEKAHNTLKKHEDLLQKSKNTAHEIDSGEEPNNDEAECPESLKGEGSYSSQKSESKKPNAPAAASEDPSMEDEPLSEDGSEEDESDEDESEESEEDENEYEFKKSESGMHTVEYKTLAKKEPSLKKLMSATSTVPGSVATTGKPSIGSQIGFPGMGKDENPEFHIRETQAGKKKKNPWSKTLRGEIDRTKTGNIKSNPEDQKRFESEAKERRDKFMGRKKEE